MKRFRKIVNLVVEGIVSGDRVDIAVRPAEDEVAVTDICISNGDSSSCRRILLEVPRGALGWVALDVDTKSVSSISIGARLDIKVELR